MRKWRIEDSEELYNIKGWGVSYFGINDKGHAYVSPRKNSVRVDLKEVVDELALRGRKGIRLQSRPFHHFSYKGEPDAPGG